MNPKIAEHHRSRSAYVYLRQSTPGQVLHHQESTERQYALREKAQELGWSEASIRTLAPRRFICFQVSVRNSGVSRCASDGKRSFGFDFAFFAIWSSCLDILLLPLSVQGMFPWTSYSTCPAASPCTRLSRAPSTTSESDFHRRFCLPQVGPFGCLTRPPI